MYETTGLEVVFDAASAAKVDTTTATTHQATAVRAATAADLSLILTAGRYGTSGSHAVTVSGYPSGWAVAGAIGGYAGATSYYANTVGASYQVPVGTGNISPAVTTFGESIAANTYQLLAMPQIAAPVTLAVTTARPPATVITPEVSPGLELSGFAIAGPGSSDTIESVTAVITQHQSSASMLAPSYQLWNGTTAQIGSTATGSVSTSTSNTDTVTWTGVTYAELSALRLRVYASAPAGSGYVQSVDGVSLTVNYMPYSGGGTTVALSSALAVITAQPVPAVSPLSVTITLSSALAVTAVQPPAAVTTIVPVGTIPGGPWTLAFNDDFADPHGTGQPDWTVWADHHIYGTAFRCDDEGNEIEWVPHNKSGTTITPASSILTLTATYRTNLAGVQAIDPAAPAVLPDSTETPVFTSGLVQSHPGFQMSYGYWEASIQMPSATAAPGIHPALWLNCVNEAWPPEVDIAEYGYPSTTSTWYPPTGSSSTAGTGVTDGNYHAYGVLITATAVTFYVDGSETSSYSGSWPALLPWVAELVIQIDNTAGATGFPATMNVDYVRAWVPAGVPAQPVITSLNPANGIPVATGGPGSGELVVSFTGNAGAGGTFRVTPCPVDSWADGLWTGGNPVVYTAATGSSSPLTLTGLPNGYQFTATVAAVNSSGGYSIESLPAPAGVLNASALVVMAAPLAVTITQPAASVSTATNATVTMGSALAVTTTRPAPVITVPVLASVLAVTTTRPAPAASGSAAVTAGSALAATATQPPVTVLAYPETSPGLEVYGFGSFPAVGASDTIEWVQVAVTEHQSSASMAACTFELWDYSGTPARIGSAQAGTASTSTSNVSTAVFTGVTYAQLSALRVRVYGHSAAAGYTESADGVALTVSYMPYSGGGVTVTPAVLAVSTMAPAPLVTVPVLAAVLAVTTTQPLVTVNPATYTPVGNPSGGPWVLVFDEEFADPHGTGQPDWTVWADHHIYGTAFRCDDYAPNEIEWVPHNKTGTVVSGGALSLIATDRGSLAGVQAIDPAAPANLPDSGATPTFTSGLVQSHPGFQMSYGYFEARVQLPSVTAAPGVHPAFWLNCANLAWPPEVDIAEYGYPSGTSSWWPPGGGTDSAGTGVSDGSYHVYGCKITSSAVTFYVDGSETNGYSGSYTGLVPWVIELVLEILPSAGATGFPAQVNVDYVRAWTTTGVPAQPVITSLSPVDGIPTAGTLEVSFTGSGTTFRATPCPVDSWADGLWSGGAPFIYTAATGSSSPLTLTGLPNGVRFTATVAAINGTGYSVESLPAPAGVLNANALVVMASALAVPAAQPAVTVTTSSSSNATVTMSSALAVSSTAPAPAASGSAVVTLGSALAVTAAQPAPAVSGSAVAAPAVLAVTATEPAPAASGSAVAALLVLNLTAAQPPPVVRQDQTAAPATLAVSTTAPAPLVTVPVLPATLTVTAAQPAPAVSTSGNATVTAAVVAVTVALPPPVVEQDQHITATVVAAAATVPAPAVSGGLTAAALPATAGFPAVTAAGSATTAPAVLAAATAVPVPAVSGAATTTPATLPVTTSVPVPVVTAGGNATVTAAIVSAAAAVPAPVVRQDQVASPAVTAAATVVPAPAVAGSAAASPAVLAATAAVPAAVAGAGQTAFPAALAVTAAEPQPQASGSAALTRAALAAASSIPVPSVTTTSVTTAYPATVTAQANAPQPVVRQDQAVTAAVVTAAAGFPAPDVTTITGITGTVTWTATPAPPRWHAPPAPPRWHASPAPPRWKAALMNFEPIAAISLEEINIDWTSDLAGTEIDPTGVSPGSMLLTVQFAVPVSSGNPLAPAQPSVWAAAAWLLGANVKGYIAQGMVGPSSPTGITLTAGQAFDVWGKILGTPSSPVKFAGTIAAY